MTDPDRELLDRRRQTEVLDELHAVRIVLGEIKAEVSATAGRVARVEAEVSNHHSMLYGSATDLDGDGGVVGMLREVRRAQKITIGLLTGVAVPAALTVFATYLPRVFG